MNQPVAPRRAKLELLVRRDDQAFEVREIPSALAYLGSRPQRVTDEAYELAHLESRVAGQRNWILKNRDTDRFLLLSDPERFLWEQMDGSISLEEMATAYVLTYGEFDFEIIPNLIRKLQRAQLLTMTPTSRLRRVLARNRRRPAVKAIESVLVLLERATVSSRRVHPIFVRLYRWGGWLIFTPAAVVVALLLAVAGLVAGATVIKNADIFAAGFGEHPVAAVLAVKLLFFATVAAHQIVHGLALIHYGRRVREFGFTVLHGFIPTFYVDVTDVFMAPRRARVVTAVSGAAVHLVLGSLCFLLAVRSPQSFTQAFAAASGMVQWQAFVLALYPFCFMEMDGYHVLVDLLGVPTLKHDAVAYIRSLFRGGGLSRMNREKAMWLGYVALSTASIGAFIAFNVWLVFKAVS